MRQHLALTVSVLALAMGQTLGSADVGEPPGISAREADFYVAPDGRDNWSGRLPAPTEGRGDGPFATLERARDAVCEALAAGADRDIVVLIRGGTYRLERTAVFGLDDSAPGEHSITYAAYPGETPIFSPGQPIAGWSKVQTPPPGLPASAHGHVWSADVSDVRRLREADHAARRLRVDSARGWRFLALFEGERRLPRARGAGFGLLNGRDELPAGELRFPKGAMRNWGMLREAEIVAIPVYPWTMNILPIESVDTDAGRARSALPPTYPLGKVGSHPEQAWVENVFEVLDAPGEWVLDSAHERLYLWPTGPAPGEDLVAPVLTELIRVEGDIDESGPRDEPVRGVRFRGLTFTHGDRLPWHGRTGWGVQHDWELFDTPTAMVRFRGAEGCAVEDCRFVNSGHTALRWDLHCVGNRTVGNVIERVGGCGILLCGYGPGTKDANRGNVVANNYIHHIGQTYWHSPAVFVWQSGENRIANNHIHHTPYTGIVVSCRASRSPATENECARTVRWDELPDGYATMTWQERERYMHGRNNIIERNEIHGVMEVLGDGNCIYVSGTGGGNIVRENYCHDVWGRHVDAAIRTDNDQHDTLIERNIITRIQGHGCGICNKGGNRVRQNIIADVIPTSVHSALLVHVNYVPAGSQTTGNVFYATHPRVVAVKDLGPHPGLALSESARNLYYSRDLPGWAAAFVEAEQKDGRETDSRTGDPLFVDPDRDDFRFRPTSPALELGIDQPVMVGMTGLESPYRERFIGPRIRTAIQPAGGRFGQPPTISMTSASPDAEIRYTLDGSAPTPSSLLYAGPFALADHGVVRARSFAEGATDLDEAHATFLAARPPIDDGFEGTPVGQPAAHATTLDENPQMTIRVVDEEPAQGARCLRFVDGPGQRYAFNPHLYYETRHDSGEVRLSFDLRVDPSSQLNVQWRQYSTARRGFAIGPDIHIGPNGKLVAARKTIGDVPIGQWVHVEVTGEVGPGSPGTYRLVVTLPDQQAALASEELPYRDAFEIVEWLGFIATGTEDATFDIDNVQFVAWPRQ